MDKKYGEERMIIVQVPKKDYSFLRNIVKKLRRLEKNKSYRLDYKLYFSDDDALILLKEDPYHLAFALSVKLKCMNRGLNCPVVLSVPLPNEFINERIWEAAQAWSLHRLPSKYLKLREADKIKSPRDMIRKKIIVSPVKIEKKGDKIIVHTPYSIITLTQKEIRVQKRENIENLKL